MNRAGLIGYFLLPPEVSSSERGHLERVNRWFRRALIAHVPVFVALGWFNGTGAWAALVLSGLSLLGPLVATLAFRDRPRWISVAHGVGGMCMGGVLVHLGQGPVQIEMHFYFFIYAAILVAFANPFVVWAGLATVGVHHLVVWYLFPASVFNYDASIWVVLLHAAFLAAESVVVATIARDYHERVIGLEQIIASRTTALSQRNKDMRLILENVHEGFLTLDLNQRVGSEYSRVLENWLGPAGDLTFAEWVGGVDPSAEDWVNLGWEMLQDGFMPAEVCLAQLPNRIEVDGTTLEIQYAPIEATVGGLVGVMVNISDRTAEELAKRASQERNELVAMTERFIADRSGFLEFYEEAREMIRGLETRSWADGAECKRWLHTLKGNAMLFGLDMVGELCHELEHGMIENGVVPTEEMLEPLLSRWSRLVRDLERLTAGREEGTIELDQETYRRHLAHVLAGRPHDQLAAQVRTWSMESTATRLQRIAEQTLKTAARMGKEHVRVEVDDQGLYLDPDRWGSFWQAFVHVIRNAVDHGVDSPDERSASGKDDTATIAISTRLELDGFVVEIADDGKGIDRQRLRKRAAERGLDLTSDDDEVLQVLFLEGVSTREEATAFSGRGVGMAAVKEAAEALGGTIEVTSQVGRGTSFRFRFPTQSGVAREVA